MKELVSEASLVTLLMVAVNVFGADGSANSSAASNLVEAEGIATEPSVLSAG